jgi:hypothetical protein
MKYGLYFLVAGLFIITSANECKKIGPPTTDNGLPLATQTGANIFACRVNGVNWIAKNSIYNRGGGVVGDTIYTWGAIQLQLISMNDLTYKLITIYKV